MAADVSEADLGSFWNAVSTVDFSYISDIWGWLKGVITFFTAAIATVTATTMNVIPTILQVIQNCVSIVDGATPMQKPGQLPIYDFLNIANTFFPIKEGLSFLTVFYTLKFALFTVYVVMSAVRFGEKFVLKAMLAILFGLL